MWFGVCVYVIVVEKGVQKFQGELVHLSFLIIIKKFPFLFLDIFVSARIKLACNRHEISGGDCLSVGDILIKQSVQLHTQKK